MTQEEKYMKAAIREAKKAYALEEVPIGCVIVQNDRIIARGYNRRNTEGNTLAHAELTAIKKASKKTGDWRLEDCTLYVTLEPCCHHGKQPPCTEALAQSGIRRVYIGSRDPNPLVSGKGIAFLREHGIEVIPDFLREQCDQLNSIFFRYITTKMPYTILKYAMTADGKIACAGGASKWVTGEAARAHVRQTRKRVAAICVGIGTVLADDPMLTCRCENPSQPVRVVLDTRLRIPMESQLVQTAREVPVIVFCYNPDQDKKAALEAAGVTVLEAKLLPKEELDEIFLQHGAFQIPREELHGRHISLRNCLEQLGQRGLDSVLIEGGATIHAAALQENCCDLVQVYVAPKLFGGDGLSPIGDMGITAPDKAILLSEPTITRLGQDLLLEYTRKEQF